MRVVSLSYFQCHFASMPPKVSYVFLSHYIYFFSIWLNEFSHPHRNDELRAIRIYRTQDFMRTHDAARHWLGFGSVLLSGRRARRQEERFSHIYIRFNPFLCYSISVNLLSVQWQRKINVISMFYRWKITFKWFSLLLRRTTRIADRILLKWHSRAYTHIERLYYWWLSSGYEANEMGGESNGIFFGIINMIFEQRRVVASRGGSSGFARWQRWVAVYLPVAAIIFVRYECACRPCSKLYSISSPSISIHNFSMWFWSTIKHHMESQIMDSMRMLELGCDFCVASMPFREKKLNGFYRILLTHFYDDVIFGWRTVI